jgi:hypothetical protein
VVGFVHTRPAMTGAMTRQRFCSTSARTTYVQRTNGWYTLYERSFFLKHANDFRNCADEDEVPVLVGIPRRSLVQHAETTMTEQIKVHTNITFTKTGDDPHTFVPHIVAKKDLCIMATSIFPTHLKLGQTGTADPRFVADDAFSTDPDPTNEDNQAWNAPSGFILKLFQMINGPEDTITVSSVVRRPSLIVVAGSRSARSRSGFVFMSLLDGSASRACVVATLLDDIGIGRASYGLPLDPGR